MILLESDNESDSFWGAETRKQNAMPHATSQAETFSEFGSRFTQSHFSLDNEGSSTLVKQLDINVLRRHISIYCSFLLCALSNQTFFLIRNC